MSGFQQGAPVLCWVWERKPSKTHETGLIPPSIRLWSLASKTARNSLPAHERYSMPQVHSPFFPTGMLDKERKKVIDWFFFKQRPAIFPHSNLAHRLRCRYGTQLARRGASAWNETASHLCQESPRQTKPKKGQFMNFSRGQSGTKVRCESHLFSQGKAPEFTKMGRVHELFVLALSLVGLPGRLLTYDSLIARILKQTSQH